MSKLPKLSQNLPDPNHKRKCGTTATVLSIAAILMLGFAAVLFLLLYLEKSSGFVFEYAEAFKLTGIIIIALLTAIAVIFQLYDNSFVYRFCLTVLAFATIALSILHFLNLSGFWEKVSNVNELRDYIADAGSLAVVVLLLMQFLQVVILPIPGFVAVGAAVALFGAFKGAVLSFIGIFLGSIVGFFIGRKFGVKAAGWLVGSDNLQKGLNSVKGKDKIVLTLMFLLPFFPDDVLCFVAGLSSMSVGFFIVMITATRLISVFSSAYSISGNIIPFNTWWGITIWLIIILLTILLTICVYKNGEKIENYFRRKFRKKKL